MIFFSPDHAGGCQAAEGRLPAAERLLSVRQVLPLLQDGRHAQEHRRVLRPLQVREARKPGHACFQVVDAQSRRSTTINVCLDLECTCTYSKSLHDRPERNPSSDYYFAIDSHPYLSFQLVQNLLNMS